MPCLLCSADNNAEKTTVAAAEYKAVTGNDAEAVLQERPKDVQEIRKKYGGVRQVKEG